MKRETRRDRRARLAPETLEGRELMSVAALPAIRPVHHQHRHVHPTTPRPHRVHSFQEPPRNIDPTPLSALVRGPKATFTGVVTAGPDANGLVTITGTTYRRARVSLDLGAKGTNEETVRADAKGRFHLTVTVGFGSTPVRLSETAHGHRATSIILTVNRNPVPPSAPGTSGNPAPPPPGASPLPVGTWDYIYEQLAIREVTDKLTLTIPPEGPGKLEYAVATTDVPLDPSSESLVHWVYVGNWSVQGSHLIFVGQGTISETSQEDPATDRTYTVNGTFDFPFAQVVKNGTSLDIVLDPQFGLLLSSNGPTRDLEMTMIG